MRKLLALLFVVLMATPTIWADEESEEHGLGDAFAQRAELFFKIGDAKRITELLQGEDRSAALSDPAATLRTCLYGPQYLVALIEATKQEEAVEGVVAAIQKLATDAVAANADAGEAHAAEAAAWTMRGRFERLREDGEPLAEFWEKASASSKRAAELLAGKKSEHLANAIGSLLEAAAPGDAGYADYLQQAQSLADGALTACSSKDPIRLAMAGVVVARVEELMRNKKKGPAKKIAIPALEMLEPLTKRKDDTQEEAIRRFNRLVRSVRDHNLGDKRDFVVKQARNSRKLFSFDVPQGGVWEVTGGRGQIIQYLTRSEVEGIFTTISITRYTWDTDYSFDEGTTGGDNIGGLTAVDRKDELKLLSKVKRDKKKIAGRLSKKITKTVGYMVSGIDTDDRPTWIRVWGFKGKHHRMSFLVRVKKRGGTLKSLGMDSEIERILDSLVESE